MSQAVKHPAGLKRSGMSPASLRGSEQSRILSIGRDPELLASRAEVLRISGCLVQSTAPEQVRLLPADSRFSVVVFGHTLSDAETMELAGYFRRSTPRTKLLITCFDPRSHAIEALFNSCVRSTDGPATLVGAVRALLGSGGRADTNPA